MLPTSLTHPPRRFRFTSVEIPYLPEYIRRMINYPQMDLEYTFWQMVYLCISPSKVYRATSWHKQTKNQWARDDPAFVAIMILFLAIGSLAYAVAFQEGSVVGLLRIMFSTILIDFLLVGFTISTICWFISNRFLVVQTIHSAEQRVEWLYSFDIHCNSFFPFFLITYTVQYALLPLLLQPGFFATFLSNTMYLAAFGVYFYNTFLGYNVLPFLDKTVCFLYPVGVLAVVYAGFLLFNYNLSIFVMNSYFGAP